MNPNPIPHPRRSLLSKPSHDASLSSRPHTLAARSFRSCSLLSRCSCHLDLAPSTKATGGGGDGDASSWRKWVRGSDLCCSRRRRRKAVGGHDAAGRWELGEMDLQGSCFLPLLRPPSAAIWKLRFTFLKPSAATWDSCKQGLLLGLSTQQALSIQRLATSCIASWDSSKISNHFRTIMKRFAKIEHIKNVVCGANWDEDTCMIRMEHDMAVDYIKKTRMKQSTLLGLLRTTRRCRSCTATGLPLGDLPKGLANHLGLRATLLVNLKLEMKEKKVLGLQPEHKQCSTVISKETNQESKDNWR